MYELHKILLSGIRNSVFWQHGKSGVCLFQDWCGQLIDFALNIDLYTIMKVLTLSPQTFCSSWNILFPKAQCFFKSLASLDKTTFFINQWSSTRISLRKVKDREKQKESDSKILNKLISKYCGQLIKKNFNPSTLRVDWQVTSSSVFLFRW